MGPHVVAPPLARVGNIFGCHPDGPSDRRYSAAVGLEDELARLEWQQEDAAKLSAQQVQRDGETAQAFAPVVRAILVRGAQYLRESGCPTVCLLQDAHSFTKDGSSYASDRGKVIGQGWLMATTLYQGDNFVVTAEGRVYSTTHDPAEDGERRDPGAQGGIFRWRPTRYISEERKLFSRTKTRTEAFYGNDETLMALGATPGLVALDARELPVEPRHIEEGATWRREPSSGDLINPDSGLPLYPTFGVCNDVPLVIMTLLMGETGSYRRSFAKDLNRWAAEAIQYQRQIDWESENVSNISYKN